MQLRHLIPTDTPHPLAPHLTTLTPSAALPGGRVEITGTRLGPDANTIPTAFIGETPASLALSRETRATLIVPEGAIASDLSLLHGTARSNALPLRVAVPLFDAA